MDKAFENMDKRFKNIEAELNYKYDSKLWNDVEGLMGDTALDSAFVNAASTAAFSPADFSGLNDAFLDDAFIEGAKTSKNNYQSSYFNEFKKNESELYENDSFINAASLASVTYQSEFWNDADVALQQEGLHHEYRPDYWREAEKLLLKDERKGFFLRWGAIATILLLLSFAGIQFNQVNTLSNQISDAGSNSEMNVVSNTNNVINSDFEMNNVVMNDEFVAKDNDDHLNNIDNQVDDVEYSTIDNLELKKEKDLIAKKGDKDINDLEPDYSIYNVVKKNQNDELVINSNYSVEKMNRENEFYLSESVPNSNILSNPITNYPPPSTKNILGVKIEKGLGNNFGNDVGSISPRNSLLIDYRFSPIKKVEKISFGVDFGLYHMNLDNFEYEQNYSVHHIEGGVEHYWYKMTYKDLVFVSTSFNTYFDFGKASKLRLGLGLDHLLTSRIGMEYQKSLETEKTDVGNDWGLNRGINKLDLSFGIGYEFKLNSKFSFLIDSKIGTVDKTNNDYLNDKKADRDVSVLFGLKYNIFAY